MEAKIQKQIIDYFSFFEEFHNSSKTCLKDCQNCAVVINKLIGRCRKIKQANVTEAPLVEFDALQSKLIASLHNLISHEIREIRSNLSTVEDLFEKLCNKHKVLQDSCNYIDCEQQSLLVKGTPFQPALKTLLQFAEDTLTYGSEVCGLIESSLTVLTYKELDSDPLVDNFRIPANWQKRIPEIISYTSFCSENQI